MRWAIVVLAQACFFLSSFASSASAAAGGVGGIVSTASGKRGDDIRGTLHVRVGRALSRRYGEASAGSRGAGGGGGFGPDGASWFCGFVVDGAGGGGGAAGGGR